MKNRSASLINKEKLVFSGVALLLAGCFYYLLTSRPAELEPGAMTSAIAPPAPVAAEKSAKGVADVAGMLNAAGRANPFQPVTMPPQHKNEDDDDGMWPDGTKWPKGEIGEQPPIAPSQPTNPTDPVIRSFPGSELPALVAFSAYVTMNGQTYGHVKTKDGRTIQVKVGDYLDEFKYTVTKIEKQAIWVTDERERVFVARDLTFADNGAGR